MKTLLPGKPNARLQGLCSGYWENRQLDAYITGNAFVVLSSPNTILQTIYDEDSTPLDAIAVDEATGKFAAAAGRVIRIYKPYGQDDDALQWSLQGIITRGVEDGELATLSWGNAEELLVGDRSLTLYATEESNKVLWTKGLANDVKFAALTYDSSYIASVGVDERLVKIWRRLAFGSDEIRFDFTYLGHPGVVTDLRWRRPHHLDQTIDNILYTICTDSVLRIWAATDQHGLQILQLWAKLDLREALQPRAASGVPETIYYTFMIDNRDFSSATEHAIKQAHQDDEAFDPSLQHLIGLATRSPEVCIILDNHGNMSAWGLENVGCKGSQISNVSLIVQVSNVRFECLTALSNTFMRIWCYSDKTGDNLSILFHDFHGDVHVYKAPIARLLDASQRRNRVQRQAVWTGHSASVKKLVRNVSGSTIVSRTSSRESVVWHHRPTTSLDTSLVRKSVVTTEEDVRRICVLGNGDFILLIHGSRVGLYDCSSLDGQLVAAREYTVGGKPVCVLQLPSSLESGSNSVYVAVIDSTLSGCVYYVDYSASTVKGVDGRSSLRQCSQFELADSEDIAYILPVDPAGSKSISPGFLDTFARDIALSFDHSGFIRFWTARIDHGKETVEWLCTCSVESGIIKPALASGSSMRKAALVDSSRTRLTVWDVRAGQLEHSVTFESDRIQDLDWTSTPDNQSILAVGFQHSVKFLSQMRYDYLNEQPAWTTIRVISIRDFTPHPIGDSTWLSDGCFVIGAGNQSFIYDRKMQLTPDVVSGLHLPQHKGVQHDIFEVVSQINGPLPVFHPQFLVQCIYSGKIAIVQQVLLALHKTLRYHVDGESIDNYLNLPLEIFYDQSADAVSKPKSKELGTAFVDLSFADDEETFSDDIAIAINEKLQTLHIPQLSSKEQIQLVDLVESMAVVEKQQRSLDENAIRFMLAFRQNVIMSARTGDLSLSWREINWAYHSKSQDILIDLVSRQHQGNMVWKHARDSGIFMWLSDLSAVKAQFEVLARNEYTKSDMKNPIDCSLFYLALKKKTVLSGLWRLAGWNREQAATLRLLANNFQDPKWRTVALKNAYALLGKHRYGYAAAFFLLADSLRDAINVCLNQLKDVQLAIVIARVYEGDDSPVFKDLLEKQVLPLAAEQGNRWLASWAFWMLNRKDMGITALLSTVNDSVETTETTESRAKSYLSDDPAFVVLYAQLRQSTLQTLRGASQVSPETEWTFVMHSAQLYDRMGCDLLGLDLVRNWEFLALKPVASTLENDDDPRKMVRRRSSLIVADMPANNLTDLKGNSANKRMPTAFQEPESSSLLDSFGF